MNGAIGYFSVPFLDLCFAVVALLDEHRRNKLCRCGLELGYPRLVFLQLVFVPAELLGTDGVLLLERLDSFHDAV